MKDEVWKKEEDGGIEVSVCYGFKSGGVGGINRKRMTLE